MKKLLVVLLVLGLAAPAMAQQWNFYGSIRTHLGYYDADEDFIGGPAMDGTIAGGAAGDSDSGTLLSLSAQSRFGARGVVSDKLYGLVEFGLRETSRATPAAANSFAQSTQDEAVYLRLIFGEYNFGTFKLRAGKAYTPGTFLGYSNFIGDIGDQGDAVMLTAGLPYIGRQPLIQLTFGTFELALIEQNKHAGLLADAPTLADRDFDLPRIEAAYTFRTPVVSIRPVAGFQTMKYESATDSERVDSWLVGLGASFTFGPAYVKVTGSYLENPGNYGQASSLLVLNAVLAGLSNATVADDAELIQGTLVVGARLSPMIGIEAGVGYQMLERGDADQDGMLYYLQAPITLAKGLQLIPEIGMVDRGDFDNGLGVTVDGGRMFWVDINFRIDF